MRRHLVITVKVEVSATEMHHLVVSRWRRRGVRMGLTHQNRLTTRRNKVTDKEKLQKLWKDAKKQKKQKWEGIKSRTLKDLNLPRGTR